MTTVALELAPNEIADWIRDVRLGGHVLIMDGDEPVAEIVPTAAAKGHPRFGSAKGAIEFGSDFDAPLPDFDAYMK
jgi:antitoxin (DNA-binding transcriptional repressor) of toxin-antitoxin stability system